MNIDRVLEAVLYVPDLDAAERFYTEVIGLTLHAKMEGRHVFFRCGRTMVLLFNPTATSVPMGDIPTHGAHGPGHIAFAIADHEYDAVRQRLAERGVPIEREITWDSGVTSIYVRDPAGNSVEFVSPRLWGIE